jgi:hypothetical protein
LLYKKALIELVFELLGNFSIKITQLNSVKVAQQIASKELRTLYSKLVENETPLPQRGGVVIMKNKVGLDFGR